jgi:hypothetical protein
MGLEAFFSCRTPAIMRIDPDRFFVLAVALASACRSSHPTQPARSVEVPPAKRVDSDPPHDESLPTDGDALRARCDALPRPSALWKETCGGKDSRAPLCHEIVEEHLPEVAGAAVECLAQLDSACAYCEFLLCRWGAIERAEKRHVAECDPIREQRDGISWADICDRYASTLSRRGLEKLAHCLDTAPPPGIECYTESALTPCSEQDIPVER